MIRVLLALLVMILTLSASGISSAFVSELTQADDCCVDGAERTAAAPSGAEDDHERRSGDDSDDSDDGHERGGCPPLCHKCACSPAFSLPLIHQATSLVLFTDRRAAFVPSFQLPPSPFGEGVFHPPRRLV